MDRAATYLMRALFAVAVTVSLGFGANQAFASEKAAVRTCPALGYDYAYTSCGFGCPGGRGYCSEGGLCRCGDIP